MVAIYIYFTIYTYDQSYQIKSNNDPGRNKENQACKESIECSKSDPAVNIWANKSRPIVPCKQRTIYEILLNMTESVIDIVNMYLWEASSLDI
jgi:hypothetical protein